MSTHKPFPPVSPHDSNQQVWKRTSSTSQDSPGWGRSRPILWQSTSSSCNHRCVYLVPTDSPSGSFSSNSSKLSPSTRCTSVAKYLRLSFKATHLYQSHQIYLQYLPQITQPNFLCSFIKYLLVCKV